MTTATLASPPAASVGAANGSLVRPPGPGGNAQRFVFRHVNWDFYEGLLALIGERRIRISYHRGSLELMAPLWNHEWWGVRLDRALTGVGMALKRDFVCGGSTTFRRKDREAGLEPDQCYYTINAHRMLGQRELDLSVDPPPDLALEVDFTSSSLDRMGIYADLGVAEVWRWDVSGIHVYHLQRSVETPVYVVATQSLSFPEIPIDRIVDFVVATQNYADIEMILAARDWAASGFPPSSPAPAE